MDNNKKDWQAFFKEEETKNKLLSLKKKSLSETLLSIKDSIKNDPHYSIKRTSKFILLGRKIKNFLLYVLYKIGLYG